MPSSRPIPGITCAIRRFCALAAQLDQQPATCSTISVLATAIEGLQPASPLPTDRARPAIKHYQGAVYRVNCPALVEKLQTLGHNTGATLYMTMLAAFNVLLHRYSGLTDIAVGTPIANRNRAEVENLIGFFVNTLVLRNN